MSGSRFFDSSSDFERMSKRRKTATGHEIDRRLFQLTDFLYTEMLPTLPLSKKVILLHCHEAGNLGDISQAFFCAKLIQKKYPDCHIKLAFILESISEEGVLTLFPSTGIDICFLPNIDFHKKEALLKVLISESTCIIGIPLGIGSSEFSQTHHRFVKEYGFGMHSDTTGNTLSMGLKANEEGISIPTIIDRQLTDMETPWVKAALLPQSVLYHMHMREWPMQMVALHAVAATEKNNNAPITVVLPLRYSLQEFIDWKILDINELKKNGIAKLCRHTPTGIETLVIAEEGKEMRVLSGPIPKVEMEAIQQHAKPLFGCTGDMSFSEAVVLHKIPFYEIPSYKIDFFKSMASLARELQLHTLADFFNQVDSFHQWVNTKYKENRPKKISWYQPEPSFELTNENSVSRICIKKAETESPSFVTRIKSLADKIAEYMLTSTQLHEEANLFADHIIKNYNFEPRLMAMVDRGLILGNYPALIETETDLWTKYNNHELTFDDACKALRDEITKATRDMSPSSAKTNKI